MVRRRDDFIDSIGEHFEWSISGAELRALHDFLDDHKAVLIDGKRGSGVTRRATERADHGGQGERLISVPPLDDRVQDVAHNSTSKSHRSYHATAASPYQATVV